MDTHPNLEITKRERLQRNESVSRVAAIGTDAIQATLSHGVDQLPESVLRDRLPLLLEELELRDRQG